MGMGDDMAVELLKGARRHFCENICLCLLRALPYYNERDRLCSKTSGNTGQQAEELHGRSGFEEPVKDLSRGAWNSCASFGRSVTIG